MFPAVNSQQRLSLNKPKSSSKKVPLKPGRSLVDWIRLTKSGVDLKGTGPRLLHVTSEELASHNKPNDIWMCIRGMVYNVTNYLEYHPGGADELMRGAGRDATSLFEEVHRWVNYDSMLKECLVGRLVDVPNHSKPRVKQDKKLLSPPTFSASGLDPLGVNTLQIDPVRKSEPTTVPQIAIEDLTPGSSSSNRLSHDWYQTVGTVVIVFYTGCSDINDNQIICDIVDGDQIFIDLHIGEEVTTFHITLNRSVGDSIKVTLSGIGKVQVTLQKEDADIHWNALGDVYKSKKILKERKIEHLRFSKCTIAEKRFVTHDTSLYRITMPKSRWMSVPIGYHVYFKVIVSSMNICKPYTVALPTLEEKNAKCNNRQDLFFIIKHYENGALTSILENCAVGDDILLSTYEGDFHQNCLQKFSNFVFLAAGTGFTPMVRVLHSLLYQKGDGRKVHVIFFNKQQEDIIFGEELNQLQAAFGGNFSCTNVLSRPTDAWDGERGRISEKLLQDILKTGFTKPNKDETFFFICGPMLFTKLALDVVSKLGFINVHAFT